jgi:4-amino-4-deoxy-L-arabinose transferase-like glycosyltransferase
MKRRKRDLPAEAATDDLISSQETEPEPYEESEARIAGNTRKFDLYTILALLIAAFCVRLYSLQFFHVISTDGTSYALNARAFAHGDLHGIGTSGFYPVLIAAANLFINNLETAGRIVSLVFGSFLVLPLYLLGKNIFSRKIAIAASLIAIVWPSLVASSCEVMTQATHTTLQVSALYIFWHAFKKPTALNGSLAGIMIGLTYLTRPESILLFATMPLALLILNYRDLLKNRALIASYCGSFLVLFVVNMILVHHTTGEWQLSAKTDSALNDALSYYLKIPDMTYIPGYEPKGYLDILKDHPDFIWKNSIKNLKATWDTMFSPLLWLFFAVGFFTGGFDREKNSVRLFLLSTFAPIAVLIVFYYISSGYIEAYQPFMFLFAAAGVAYIEEKLTGQLSRFQPAQSFDAIQRAPLLLATAFIYAVIIFAPQIRKDISDADYRFEMDNGRRAEKHIGIILKNNLPPGKIMTRWARIAFYAEREWVNIPAETEFEEIIKSAKESGVKFLIADGMLYSNRPKLGMELFTPFTDRNKPSGLFIMSDRDSRVKGLIPILLYHNPESVGVIAYEIPP